MLATDQSALTVDLAPGHPRGLRLLSPVMIASGTFGWDGYGLGFDEGPGVPGMLDLSQLGAVTAKTVTLRPRAGNPEPRWYPHSWRRVPAELQRLRSEGLIDPQMADRLAESTLLNSIGLTNPGIEAALRDHAPIWAQWEVPIVLSIAGETVEEFGYMAGLIGDTPGIEAIELNLSCPNVEHGASYALSAELTRETVVRVRANTDLPVLAKLAPNVPDLVPIALAAQEAGADALTICNTIPAMAIDTETRRPVLGAVTGGISGPALHPVAVALVYNVAPRVSIPIIGVGGIYTADHAIEFILAGATAVQVGSANLANFWTPLDVVEGIADYMTKHDIQHVGDLRGQLAFS